MDNPKDIIINKLIDYWYAWQSIYIALVLIFLLLIKSFSDFDLGSISLPQWLLITFVLISTYLLWHFTVKLPKTKKGKVGFVIAIQSENEKLRNLVESDIIQSIENVLDDTNKTANFDVITLPKWLSSKLNNSETAIKYMNKCRAHLFMYGDARERKQNGKNVYSFRLRQAVLHKRIPNDISNQLSHELSEIFPGNITIDEDQELLGLEVTSLWMSEAAKYFIAMASMISGNLELGEQLLIEVRNSKHLSKIKGAKGVARIRERANKRLCDIYSIQANYLYNKWRDTHDINLMPEYNERLEKYKSMCGSNSYAWKLRKAIWYFISEEDVYNTYKLLSSCRGTSDGTWRYSLAFIEAFKGNLDQAIKLYKKAFTRPSPDGISLEIEEFIIWALEKYPEKYQLNFCLGYINYKLKYDFSQAHEDFTLFLDNVNADNDFPDQVRLARIYLTELATN